MQDDAGKRATTLRMVLEVQLAVIDELLSLTMLTPQQRQMYSEWSAELKGGESPFSAGWFASTPSDGSAFELQAQATLPATTAALARRVENLFEEGVEELKFAAQRGEIKRLLASEFLPTFERNVALEQLESVHATLRRHYERRLSMPRSKHKVPIRIGEGELGGGPLELVMSDLDLLRHHRASCRKSLCNVSFEFATPATDGADSSTALSRWWAEADRLAPDLLFFLSEPRMFAEHVLRFRGQGTSDETLLQFSKERLEHVGKLAAVVGISPSHAIRLVARRLGFRTGPNPVIRGSFWCLPQESRLMLGLAYDSRELEIERVDLPATGTALQRGSTLATCQVGATTVRFDSPFDARVVRVNYELEIFAEIAALSSEESGWLVEVELADPALFDEIVGEFRAAQVGADSTTVELVVSGRERS
ncbi:MAG TPA: hypothetical protein VGK73_07305 [Polyangiaceae bacterium]